MLVDSYTCVQTTRPKSLEKAPIAPSGQHLLLNQEIKHTRGAAAGADANSSLDADGTSFISGAES